MSIASLVLGIIGVITAITFIAAPLGLILVIVGLILGIVDVVKKGKTGDKKGIGIAGIVICAIMVVTLLVESATIILGVGIYMNSLNALDGAYNQTDLDNNDINNEISNQLSNLAVQTFNSRFLSYDGQQTGATTRYLLTLAYNNNTSNLEHTITCTLDGNIESDISAARNQIFASKYYNISFNYDYEGYINRINIVTSYQ